LFSFGKRVTEILKKLCRLTKGRVGQRLLKPARVSFQENRYEPKLLALALIEPWDRLPACRSANDRLEAYPTCYQSLVRMLI
jgi:hypothetical protein